MSETYQANVEELKKTTASLVQKKINEREKMQILWLVGITVPKLLMMAIRLLVTVQTKTHSLLYFQTKQKSEESKQGEQSKWLQK